MTDKMNEMLTDEELDNVVGGAAKYFKTTIKGKACYYIESYDGGFSGSGIGSTASKRMCIPADKFDFVKSYYTTHGGFTEGSPAEYAAMKKAGKII